MLFIFIKFLLLQKLCLCPSWIYSETDVLYSIALKSYFERRTGLLLASRVLTICVAYLCLDRGRRMQALTSFTTTWSMASWQPRNSLSLYERGKFVADLWKSMREVMRVISARVYFECLRGFCRCCAKLFSCFKETHVDFMLLSLQVVHDWCLPEAALLKMVVWTHSQLWLLTSTWFHIQRITLTQYVIRLALQRGYIIQFVLAADYLHLQCCEF